MCVAAFAKFFALCLYIYILHILMVIINIMHFVPFVTIRVGQDLLDVPLLIFLYLWLLLLLLLAWWCWCWSCITDSAPSFGYIFAWPLLCANISSSCHHDGRVMWTHTIAFCPYFIEYFTYLFYCQWHKIKIGSFGIMTSDEVWSQTFMHWKMKFHYCYFVNNN